MITILKTSARTLQLHKIPILMLVSCAAFYWTFAYELERADFVRLLGLYAGLFFLSWKYFKMEKLNLFMLGAAALLFRLIFLFSIPNLSQDFYRFLWDGELLLQGLNPYISVPKDLLPENPFPEAKELFQGMGSLSAGNPTNYPPLNQLVFALAGFFSGKSILNGIIILRSIIIAADFGIFYFGRKLLQKIDLPKSQIFWYLLNPFVIIETTGNLHFEGVMIFFLLLALLLLQQRKWLWSSVFFSLSVLTKLIPLLFLPLIFKHLGLKKGMFYCGLAGIISLAFFLPFTSGIFIENFFQSIGLWFQKFEFNASFYYLVRWAGFQVAEYNIIQVAGPLLGFFTFLSILGLAFFRSNVNMQSLITSMMFGFVIYLFFSTTVHPWYLATPLFLSIFTRYRFMIIWSFLVILSYLTYSNIEFEENLWLIAVEYLIVFGVLINELLRKRPAFAHQDA